MFDGKVYGVPLTAAGTTSAFTWFNKDLLKRADVDPDRPPTTYDGLRAAARKVKSLGGGVYGLLLPTQTSGGLINPINDLAAAAGSPTDGGIDIRTGEYAFHNDEHAAVIERWLAMKQDGTLFPGGAALDDCTGRGRFFTGAAGFLLNAQFLIGVAHDSAPPFVPKTGLGYVATPDGRTDIKVAQGPVAAAVNLWISKGSKHVAEASKLISLFANRENQKLFTKGMNAPPLYPVDTKGRSEGRSAVR